MWSFLLWLVLAPARADDAPVPDASHEAAPPTEHPTLPSDPVVDETSDGHDDEAPHEHGVPGAVEADVHGDDEESHEGDHGTAHHHPPNIIAIRMLTAMTTYRDGPHGRWGLGLYYEREIVPRWLEVEIAAAALAGRDGPLLVLDVFVKKPIDLGKGFELHTGVGPVLQIEFVPEEHREDPEDKIRLEPGGIATIDFYAWPVERIGLLAELDAAVISSEGTARFEGEFAIGVAFRF